MFVNQASTNDLFFGNPSKHFLGLSAGGGDSSFHSIRSLSQCCSSNLEISQQTDSQDLFSQTQKTELPESEICNSNYQRYVSEGSLFGKMPKFSSKPLVSKGLNIENSCDITDLKAQLKQDERKILCNIQEAVSDASSGLTNVVKTLKEIVESHSKKNEQQIVSENKWAMGITQLSQELKCILNLLEEHGKQLQSQHAKCLENEEFIKHAVNNLEKFVTENHLTSVDLISKLLNKEKNSASLLSEVKSYQMSIIRDVDKQVENKLSSFFHSWDKRYEEYERKFENCVDELKKCLDVIQSKNCSSSLNSRETHVSSKIDVKEIPCNFRKNSPAGCSVPQFSNNCITSSVQQHCGSKSVIVSVENVNENHSPDCGYDKHYKSSYNDGDDELGIFTKRSCLSVMSMKRHLHKHFSNKSNASLSCTELQNSINKWSNKPECKLFLMSNRCNGDDGKISSHFNSLPIKRKRNHPSLNIKKDICEKQIKNFQNPRTLVSCSSSIDKCDNIAYRCSSNKKSQCSRKFKSNRAAVRGNAVLTEVTICDSNSSADMLSSYDSSPCMSVQNFTSSYIVPQNASFSTKRLCEENTHKASLNSISNAFVSPIYVPHLLIQLDIAEQLIICQHRQTYCSNEIYSSPYPWKLLLDKYGSSMTTPSPPNRLEPDQHTASSHMTVILSF